MGAEVFIYMKLSLISTHRIKVETPTERTTDYNHT